eukprot:4511158-Alexandrium_andersonii.AAC.1
MRPTSTPTPTPTPRATPTTTTKAPTTTTHLPYGWHLADQARAAQPSCACPSSASTSGNDVLDAFE